ncbi:type II secretion system protein PulP [Geomonas sp. Red32]|uniref:type II secretion system protein PulP n=1 Tax=Geomonas sp. Red32 TaxID=2912856 RepID=UPI00202CEE51|nr:type II secretion system protein PulP [Geomonas sp. Red32]MCM0082023.1 type II secretion system protein PulP [Geomonas sp. Red32]
MNRQKLILAVLLLVFGCSLVYSYVKSPKQRLATQSELARPAVPAKRAPVQAKTRTAPPAPANVPANAPAGAPAKAPSNATSNAASGDLVVRLDLLDRVPSQTGGSRRNIFSPIFRDEAKLPPFKPLPPLPKAAKLPPPPMLLPQVLPPQPPPPPPEPPVNVELGKFNFVGFLKKNGDKTVFLSKNNEVFLAKKGSKIAGDFMVTDITDESLTLKALPTGKELAIPLVENRAMLLRHSRRNP